MAVQALTKEKVTKATRAQKITPEEYLFLERQSDARHEYKNGAMSPMTGATLKHNLLVVSLIGLLYRLVGKQQWTVLPSDMRVRIGSTSDYTYPDVVVVCETPLLEDSYNDTLLNPCVIFEVLSPTTERYDRGDKFAKYRTIDSLTDYLLVSQEKAQIEHYVRQPDNKWLLSEHIGLSESVTIETLDCQLSLAEVYEKIDLKAESTHRPESH